MSSASTAAPARSSISLHRLGVLCGLAAGAWLGAAEAPTKFVNMGVSPFVITLGMVMGVFVARWTLPMALKGTRFLLTDLREKPHLILWATLAGMLWSVANTLTVFAIRDVGLSIAFPLWNTNSLVGLFWGWLLFGELRNAGARAWSRVLGGSAAIVLGATVLAWATTRHDLHTGSHSTMGIVAALGAGLLWGTMYIPYRKAYISGMNPLSLVTVFTFGELGSTLTLGAAFHGGIHPLMHALALARPILFWLFLGGFCWVIGDLFQQYAARYVGIGRGIPLSNTNQLWGLAWGALVFGELHNLAPESRGWILGGSLLMIAGAVAIALAAPPQSELTFWRRAVQRECDRYGLDPKKVEASLNAEDEAPSGGRSRWELLLPIASLGIFVWMASGTSYAPLPFSLFWMVLLLIATLLFLAAGGFWLWRRTRFS